MKEVFGHAAKTHWTIEPGPNQYPIGQFWPIRICYNEKVSHLLLLLKLKREFSKNKNKIGIGERTTKTNNLYN